MKKLSSGVVHKLTPQIRKALLVNNKTADLWNNLTPLGRNEYICWITSAKKEETTKKRIDWMISDLKKGKRRPCCWPGCSHRKKK